MYNKKLFLFAVVAFFSLIFSSHSFAKKPTLDEVVELMNAVDKFVDGTKIVVVDGLSGKVGLRSASTKKLIEMLKGGSLGEGALNVKLAAVKRRYKKLALVLHPDRVQKADKEKAHKAMTTLSVLCEEVYIRAKMTDYVEVEIVEDENSKERQKIVYLVANDYNRFDNTPSSPSSFAYSEW